MFRQFFAILLLTAVGAGVGYGASLVLPTQWQAVTKFEAPKTAELGNYLSLSSTYSLVSGAENAADLSKIEAQTGAQSYAEFQKMVNDAQLRQEFLTQYEPIKQQAALENKSVATLVQAVEKSISFTNDTLSVSSLSALQAESLIGDYIRFINTKTKEKLNQDLVAKWKALFQQVKAAAESKIDASWENKLKMMQSVSPLDNQLVAFRFVQMPKIEAVPFDYIKWIGGGAGAGFILSLIMILLFSVGRKKAE